MPVAWGTFALQHPRATAELERCASCGQDAVERRAVERTSHLIALPLFPRGFRWTARCGHCQRVEVGAFARGAAPRRRMAWRIAAAWALLAGAIGVALVGGIARGQLSRARAAAPEVGDEWTIRAARWPGLPDGALAFARARIDTIEHDIVNADACGYTSDDDNAIEARCTQYPIELPPIRVGAVRGLVESGAITSIWRGGDPMRPYDAAAGGLVFLAIVDGLLAWRVAKRSFRGDERIPRAELV